MAKITATDIAKAVQTELGLEQEPSGREIASAMYDMASPQFREYMGDPLETESLDFMNGLLDYPETLATEWVTLATRLGKVIAHNNIINNRLKPFKMEPMPLGYTMEEYFVDVAKEHAYNQQTAESEQFKRELPDIKNIFYVVNRKSFYKQTITEDDFRSYFVSWNGVNGLIAKIVNALYNGDNKDDYNYMKRALVSHYDNGFMKVVKMDAPVTDTESAKALARSITEYASLLTEPTSDYNAMGVTKQNEVDDLYIILTAKSNSHLNVDWLAQTFQLEVASFKAHVLLIPTLPTSDNGNIEALLVDKEIYRVFDQKYNVTTKYNAEGLYWNYWLHHWEGIATSRFANAIAFVSGSADDTVTGIELNPDVITIKAGETKTVKINVKKTGIDAPVTLTATASGSGLTPTVENNDTLKIVADSPTAGLQTITVKDTPTSVTAILNVVVTE